MLTPRKSRSSKNGLVSFYRRFIPNFSILASLLNKLVKKNVPFVSGEREQKAFDEIKAKLIDRGRTQSNKTD